ncbi:hypothetical protein GF358_01635 [Candidatus Woesearchaeota archaeon]|nr:hypothetical protein [Candidatus Woesearchaeota archaeon]
MNTQRINAFLFLLVGLVPLFFIGCSSTESVDNVQFKKIAIDSLYDNGFCYTGMESQENKRCGEADYPFVRVFNAEDFTSQGMINLAVQVGEDINYKMPETKKRIVFVFRDQNQKSVEKIYWENGKWSR